ncbi:MAG: cytochrome c4 [Gammaproteobacteria bacterium]|nr:cytochrome c4 [Gammaproteobacteria bacterium]
MSLSHKFCCILLGCLLSLSIHAKAPDQASMLANACAACHGPDGSSQGPATPSIAEISYDYFIDTMMAFKNDERPSTVMSRIAKGYTEKEITLMAVYFARKKMKRIAQEFDPVLAKAGKAIHEENCEKCHANQGRLSEDDSGLLAGQKMPYLRYSLEEFINEEREVSRKMLKKLRLVNSQYGKQGLEQLIHYYGSLKD